MIDITRKRTSLRRAIAEAVVTMSPGAADAVLQGRVPKGDVLAISRAAALLAIKRTPELLPFCHPIPLERAEIEFDVQPDRVVVRVSVSAIARTGVEVEAMTGATIAALNVFDMVKPLDPRAAIAFARVVEKSGGKSDHAHDVPRTVRAGVIVVSDSVSRGAARDTAGAAAREALLESGIVVEHFSVVPDEPSDIERLVTSWCDDERLDLILAVGGTGLGPRDVTPESLLPLFDREIPGLGEAIRAHGRERTPRASLSRAIAGQRGNSIIIGTAGSECAAREAMDALLPWLTHAFDTLDGGFRHGR